jgi:hypothetical protein
VPGYRPPVSPYINLARQGNAPALNPGIAYYGIIRPQLEFGGSIQQLQQRQVRIAEELTSQEQQQTLPLPTTGHTVGFLTQSSYFLNLRPQAGGGQFLPTTSAIRPPRTGR